MTADSILGKRMLYHRCPKGNPYSVQDWNGNHHVFEVKIVHSDIVQHISTASTTVLIFNNAVTYAYISCTKSVNVQGNGGDGN